MAVPSTVKSTISSHTGQPRRPPATKPLLFMSHTIPKVKRKKKKKKNFFLQLSHNDLWSKPYECQ